MSYIGNPVTQVAFLTDQFSGNGSTTVYTMSVAPANSASVIVAVSGVVQDPTTYAVADTTLTFSTAPPSGTANISCRYLGIPASGVATSAYRTKTEFTATAGQTTFTPPSYTVGYIDVFLNGVLLGSADYTATNGTTVVLATGAAAGNIVTVEALRIDSVLNAIPNAPASVGNSNIVDGAVTPAKLSTGAPVWDSSYNLGVGYSNPSAFASGLDLVVGSGTTAAGVSLFTNTSGVGGVYFADGATSSDRYRGYVEYDHSNDSLILGTSTATRLTINSSGYVTTPYQPGFVAGLSSGQLLTINVYQTLIPNFTSRNQGSAYNTSTGIFTAPVAGMYLFTLVTLFYPVASGTNLDTRYLVNGATPTNKGSFQGTAPPGNHCNRELSFIVYLAVNDTFQIQARPAVSGVQFYGDQTAYSGMLLG